MDRGPTALVERHRGANLHVEAVKATGLLAALRGSGVELLAVFDARDARRR